MLGTSALKKFSVVILGLWVNYLGKDFDSVTGLLTLHTPSQVLGIHSSRTRTMHAA